MGVKDGDFAAVGIERHDQHRQVAARDAGDSYDLEIGLEVAANCRRSTVAATRVNLLVTLH